MFNTEKFFNLKNKIIFVVGGSGLLGTHICNLLNQLGAKVYNFDIKKNKTLNKNIKNIYFDIKKNQEIEKKFKKYFNEFDTPDCFINCSYPTTKDWSKSDFKSVSNKSILLNLNVHLASYIWLARIVAEQMRKKKVQGSIIQFGSHYGVIGQNSDLYKGTKMRENMIYSAIKGGIIANTKQICSHFGKFGIRANCICPGGIEGHVKGKKIKQDKKFLSRYKNRTPLKRLAKPEEIAPAAAFLASKTSSYISGVTLLIDGGWTAT